MALSTTRSFSSRPIVVAQAIMAKISREYPAYASDVKWDGSGTQASVNRFGVSVEVHLVESTGTIVTATVSVPLLVPISESTIINRINQFFDELKQVVP